MTTYLILKSPKAEWCESITLGFYGGKACDSRPIQI